MNIAAEQLKSYIERINTLESEKATVADHIRDVYAEAKGNGFDTKALRQVIKLSRMSPADRNQQEEVVHMYSVAAGLVSGE